MIHRTHWRHLDDCNIGCQEHQVDWAGCPSGLKMHLIGEYNMGVQIVGYQPKDKSKKEYWYDDPSTVLDPIMNIIGLVGYPILIYFLWPVFMAQGMPIIAAAFVSLAIIIPWVFISVIVGGAIGFSACIVSDLVHSIVLKNRSRKQARVDEFDNFIKGCRDGRN